MASNKKQQDSTQDANKGDLLSVLTAMSNDQIKKQMCEFHVHTDKNFDVRTLFVVVKDILNRVTLVVDNDDLGAKQACLENLEEEAIKACISLPFCTLKQLSFDMACKAPNEDIARKTTTSILKKLSSYSWNTKAVLTLGAFALDYGEFWLLDQLHTSNQLAKSVGILKGMTTIIKHPDPWLQIHKKVIVELNNLIKGTLDVIDCIFKLEDLYAKNDTIHLPELSTAIDNIPIDVYWVIITVVACTTQMRCLNNNEDKKHDLFPLIEKINVTLDVLKRNIEVCDEQIRYVKLVNTMRNPEKITKAFNEMRFNPLINGSTNIEVDIERKNIILFFSDLDISNEYISNLEPIYKEISKNKDQNKYEIVWIPIVDKWTDDMQKKFETLRSKMPPWYIVQNFSFELGTKYIKEKWQFKDKPIVVVMNSQGIVEHPSLNALRMITISGPDAFPFTPEKEQELSNGEDWSGYWMFNICPEVSTWMIQGKYIFFYGGKDEKWRKQFTEKVTDLLKDPVKSKISIELCCVERYNRLESLLSSGHSY